MTQINYGILGFGLFAERRIVPAFLKCRRSKLIAIHKRDIQQAKARAKQYDIPYFYDNETALLENEKVDAIFVCSPNSLHKEHTIRSAEAGKHVLCEKPMAMNVGECQQMIDACRSNGVKLMVAHMLRFSTVVQKARDLVQQGELGTIKFARSDFFYQAQYSQRTWVWDPNLAGGGPVFDIGVHSLDTLRFILDDDVVQTQAFLLPRPTDASLEREAQLTLRFQKGTLATIRCSFDLPYESNFELIGTRGRIWCHLFTQYEKEIPLCVQKEDEVSEVKLRVGNFYTEEVDHFSECILQDKEPLISGEDGLKNQKVLDAAYCREFCGESK